MKEIICIMILFDEEMNKIKKNLINMRINDWIIKFYRIFIL